ncbi:hypothetical protein [Maribacter halichondriae]|uniref:hypothetical protein n=1 Tax=Maribacter halichondriae TaxID=2980554 RepID=UPI002359CA45|nr:hypothetical protein [Maribacter sp. Hal144]
MDFILGKTLRHFYFTQDSGLQHRTTVSIEKTEADILIFGASKANHHYDPRILEDSLNMSAYNTGRDGQFVFYQTALLKAALKRYTPKLIILDFIGTFAYDQHDYDRLSNLLPYYEDHPELRDIILLRSPFEKYKMISQIYPYNSMLTTIAVGNLEFNKHRDFNINYDGYVPLHGVYNKKLDSVRTSLTYEIDDNKINAFEEFLTLTKQHDIPLVVIYSPIYYLYDRDFSIELCSKLCQKNGIPFIDFSRDKEFLKDINLYEDESHLNQVGVEIFTKKVGRIIKQRGLLSNTAADLKSTN